LPNDIAGQKGKRQGQEPRPGIDDRTRKSRPKKPAKEGRGRKGPEEGKRKKKKRYVAKRVASCSPQAVNMEGKNVGWG